ncbi:MAG: SPFH domain-containing protein [Planctomycetota bacterium]
MSPTDPDSFGFEEMPVEETRRAASLVLREQDARQQRAASMAVANQSLQDALGITYRLIQVVMVLLIVLFALSGLRQVAENERGVMVRFGTIVNPNVEPGFTLVFPPPPMGEILKVPTGAESLVLDDSFFFQRTPEQKLLPVSDLPTGSSSLRPTLDGSLITADGNLVHAEFAVRYRRDDIAAFVSTMHEDTVDDFVRTAVEASAIRVAAETPVDDFIRRGVADEAGASGAGIDPIASRVRLLAQERLDAMNSGIRLDSVVLAVVVPPRQTRREFEQVTRVVAEAARKRQEAESFRATRLNEVAGPAARPLLDLVNDYGDALAAGGPSSGEPILDEIFSLLSGEVPATGVVELGGRTYEGVAIAGEIAQTMSEARNARSVLVSDSQRKAEAFRAMLDQVRANPRLVITRVWADALDSMLDVGNAQVFRFPRDTSEVEITINADPDIARGMQAERQRRLLEANSRSQGLRN